LALTITDVVAVVCAANAVVVTADMTAEDDVGSIVLAAVEDSVVADVVMRLFSCSVDDSAGSGGGATISNFDASAPTVL